MNEAMRHDAANLRLKRTSTIGFGVAMIWTSLGGGYVLIRSGDWSGWLALLVGAALLLVPLTRPFRKYWRSGVAVKVFPAMVLFANAILIILPGGIASIYLGDPFLRYNDLDTIAAIVFGVAAVLSFLTLIANLISYQLDRRS